MRTVFSGFNIAAVCAMKYTPQNTITSASTSAAFRASSSESPVKSAIDYFRTIDVVEGTLKFNPSRDVTGRVLKNDGTHANIENLMKIRDGAKVEL